MDLISNPFLSKLAFDIVLKESWSYLVPLHEVASFQVTSQPSSEGFQKCFQLHRMSCQKILQSSAVWHSISLMPGWCGAHAHAEIMLMAYRCVSEKSRH